MINNLLTMSRRHILTRRFELPASSVPSDLVPAQAARRECGEWPLGPNFVASRGNPMACGVPRISQQGKLGTV